MLDTVKYLGYCCGHCDTQTLVDALGGKPVDRSSDAAERAPALSGLPAVGA